MVEHRLLQQMLQRQHHVDMGEQRDVEQGQGAVKHHAQYDPQKMSRLGAALTEKQIAGDHEKQRNADAGSRIKQVGDIPVQQADGMRVSDIPGCAVNHHHHQACDAAQTCYPVYFFLHRYLSCSFLKRV